MLKFTILTMSGSKSIILRVSFLFSVQSSDNSMVLRTSDLLATMHLWQSNVWSPQTTLKSEKDGSFKRARMSDSKQWFWRLPQDISTICWPKFNFAMKFVWIDSNLKSFSTRDYYNWIIHKLFYFAGSLCVLCNLVRFTGWTRKTLLLNVTHETYHSENVET